MKNYFTLEKFSLLFDHFAFVDVPEYYADQLFIRHQVTVHFGDEYKHPDEPYVIIFCKVRKCDRDRFLAALAELPSKMILCGYPRYDEFCREFISKMDKGAKTLREKRCADDEICSLGQAEQESAKRAS
nr:MAG TPA: hypothetical protein [Caudoviricetes sp.]